jgi:7-carboxy-7-deazaguanine synthase
MTVEEIVERVEQPHVVLTGGEPMIFDPVVQLSKELWKRAHVTIETAGTVYRDDLWCGLMSISPKLSNSIPHELNGWAERHWETLKNRTPVRQLIQRYEFQLKFVVASEQDLEEVDCILSMLPPVKQERIMLMPEGTDSETLATRMRWLVPLCLERGWRLAPRLHIELFGNTRGT